MKTLISYCKRQILWIVMLVLCIMTMSLVLYLNGISSNEITYGTVLCFFFLLAFGAYDFYKYAQKHKQLQQLKDTIQIGDRDLPEAIDNIEQDYQELLELITIDKSEQLSQLENKRRDMTEYYSMWVHQIKTPIAAMRLLLQSLENKQNELNEMEEDQITLRRDRLEEMQQIYLEDKRELEDELFRIEQYVGMALQYLRLDSETNDFVFQEQPIDKIVKEAVHKYAKLFIRKKISLHYENLDQMVLTDEKWLEFVVEQILSNAIKYTHTGGITIYLEAQQKNSNAGSASENDNRSDDNSLDKQNEYVYLVIEDTGIGIREEDLPRVCEKGYTGYNGHSDKRSSGIGLYLCYRVLKKLGHTIEITSEVGKGTRVKIGFSMKRCEE